ncbi:hypothetical protein JL721_1286 [Aureococcus anophagefferens]|nr:hypothetical protein JL721_1286 [Aureococcus anophagefferens]
MPHNAKYHEPASELYKDRLRAKVEGKPLPTQLPQRKAAPASCYDAPGGGSMSAGGFGGGDTKGAEALKGETEDQYVARQRRLQAEARDRAKFGGGGMGGVGSNSDYNPATGGYGAGGGLSLGGVGDKLKGWGAAAARASATSSHHSGASNASGDLRPEPPARSASNPAPVSALPPPAPVSRSSSAVGAGATPGKPKLAVDKDDDFFSDFGV